MAKINLNNTWIYRNLDMFLYVNPSGIPINNTQIKSAGAREKKIGAVSRDVIEPVATLTTLN